VLGANTGRRCCRCRTRARATTSGSRRILGSQTRCCPRFRPGSARSSRPAVPQLQTEGSDLTVQANVLRRREAREQLSSPRNSRFPPSAETALEAPGACREEQLPGSAAISHWTARIRWWLRAPLSVQDCSGPWKPRRFAASMRAKRHCRAPDGAYRHQCRSRICGTLFTVVNYCSGPHAARVAARTIVI